MSGGTQNSLRPPRQGPPSPRSSNFPRGVATRWRLWVRAAVAEFFHRRGRAGADGEGAAVEQRCDGGPASGVGIGRPCNGNAAAFGGRCRWESVRSTTLATMDEQSRCRVGPKNLFDRPARDPHPLVHQISPVGWPQPPFASHRVFRTQSPRQLTK